VLFRNEPFNESVQVKIDNALQFSKEIRETKMAYSNVENIPGKYTTFYIARWMSENNRPQFPHGDEY